MSKHVLIVYAHVERASFGGAMLDTAKTRLEGQGHKVTVSDLYGMNFDPVISRKDRTDAPLNPDYFDYSLESGDAFQKGTLTEDIKEEQRKVKEADLIIFQFPLQWFSVPAIMQGWLERVLSLHFSMNFMNGSQYDKGFMIGKRALLSLTTGSARGCFTPFGLSGDIRVFLSPTHTALRETGMSLLKPNTAFSPGLVTLDDRKEMLKSWEERLDGIFEEDVVTCPKMADFHDVISGKPWMGKELSPDFSTSTTKDGEQELEFGASVAQHMGRRIRDDQL